MSAPPYPKLLVATEFPPNGSGGGPAVVRQLLRGWPAERLCWWSCAPDLDARFGQTVATHRVAAIPPKLYTNRRYAHLKAALLHRLWTPWAARHFQRTLATLQPDVVWAIPHAWSILPLARVLPHAGTGFHVSIHDYADAHGMAARIGAEPVADMVRGAKHLYASACTRDAISHAMAADLLTATGKPACQVARAGVEESDLVATETAPAGSAAAVRVAYAGSIIVAREFELFARALAAARIHLKRPVEFHLFGAHRFATQPWFQEGWMIERGNLPEGELTEALRACDWGFSPMALTATDPRYNQFSFPTKFIGYLAAGLPVITLAHPTTSVMEVASRYDVGLATSADSLESLTAVLVRALSEPMPRMRHRGEIIRCARAEFDAGKMRAVLHAGFADCAARTRRKAGRA